MKGLFHPAPVARDDFLGRYAVYDDGWPGLLMLSDGGDGTVKARFHSYRFDADYEATAVVGQGLPHAIQVHISNFNELDEQVLEGYLFTATKNGFAGRTMWKGHPFGVYALRSRPSSAAPFGSGPVVPGDFAGSYAVCCDGEKATLRLDVEADGTLSGVWQWTSGAASMAVRGQVHDAVGHEVELSIDAPGAPIFTGHLFTRPKSAIAGWVSIEEVRLGCYMHRFL
jgi:hypothetical protein